VEFEAEAWEVEEFYFFDLVGLVDFCGEIIVVLCDGV